MQIQNISTDKLIEYARNPRKNDAVVDKMIACIKEFGFRIPIVAKSDGTVVDGHLRLKAARKMGLKEVPAVNADDLSEAQIKAFRLVANQSANWAEWDEELLKLEFKELDDLDFDLELTGFDLDEIEKYLQDDEDIQEDDFNEEEILEGNTKVITKPGDLWILGNHRLLCGDSTKIEDIEKLVNGEKLDLVFTDPPYGIKIVNNGQVGGLYGSHKCERGKYDPIISDDSTKTASKSFEIFSKFSSKQIIWGGNYFVNFLPFSTGWLIWDKRGENGIRNTFADGEMAWCSFKTPMRIYRQVWNGMIREGEHEKRLHPTQKPVRMLSEIIQDFSNKKEKIMDVFGGSGSTLIACEETERKCYMMELDPKYCDVIIKRWQKQTNRKAILESNGRSFDELSEKDV